MQIIVLLLHCWIETLIVNFNMKLINPNDTFYMVQEFTYMVHTYDIKLLVKTEFSSLLFRTQKLELTWYSFFIFITHPMASTAGYRPPSVSSNFVYSGPLIWSVVVLFFSIISGAPWFGLSAVHLAFSLSGLHSYTVVILSMTSWTSDIFARFVHLWYGLEWFLNLFLHHFFVSSLS